MEKKKVEYNPLPTYILLTVSLAGITFLIHTFGGTLLSAIIKVQKSNLSAAELSQEEFIMPQLSSPAVPQTINYENEHLNKEMNISSPAEGVSYTYFENCTINLSTNLESCALQNSTLNVRATKLTIENSILSNVKINISEGAIVKLNNSSVHKNKERVFLSQARLLVNESLFANNHAQALFYVEGNSYLEVKNSQFQSNDGVIFLSHTKKLVSDEGKESYLSPLLSIENNLLENNYHRPIYLENLDRIGTRITNNIFRGGEMPYITIKDSDRLYVVIRQNCFQGQGISVENSSNIILWANQFKDVSNYAVQLKNSDLIAFQYNDFKNVSPAAILRQNTPQIELVHNHFTDTPKMREE